MSDEIEFMELAVETARSCKSESGRISPKVGAVVVKDGKILLQGSTRQVFSNEKILEESFLRPPHFVQFANRIGKTFLTPNEMIQCLDKGGTS